MPTPEEIAADHEDARRFRRARAWSGTVAATVAAALVLGILRWAIPSYAQDAAREVVRLDVPPIAAQQASVAARAAVAHHEVNGHHDAIETRIDRIERGLAVLIDRGGRPTAGELERTDETLETLDPHL